MQRLPSPAWGDLYAFAKAAATPRTLETRLPLGDNPPRRTRLMDQVQCVGHVVDEHDLSIRIERQTKQRARSRRRSRVVQKQLRNLVALPVYFRDETVVTVHRQDVSSLGNR